MEKINFQKIMEEQIRSSDGTPSLLLHSCCGPCSSYVLDVLSEFFNVSVIYYNPNIFPESEYQKRLSEQIKLIEKMEFKNPVNFVSCNYDENEFLQAVNGYEKEHEGGARCEKCFRLRLEKTAQIAKENRYDFFTTTLSVSPHKNAVLLNEIGKELSEKYQINYLFADFKKKEGYKKSIILSKKYDLYRQNYCGCRFSLREEQE